jgi:two-component system NtrC family sensor kinase
VRVEVTRHTETVMFAVIDSGPGVPAELRSRIMEPFYTTKPVGKGTGLGLSLSKAFVEENGSELVLSERENHTCFSFVLPLFKEPKNATEGSNSTNC